MGMVVSRKVGNAVTRNRVTRRLREIYSLERNNVIQPDDLALDVVVIARREAATAEFGALRSALKRCLKHLGTRFQFPLGNSVER